ncbi:hypothetical protein FQN57_001435 [Myotisia sp. PD_48]|nr:hypothetical protein FQN57_001435 [Myotisia sp. PD_48]
MATPIQQNLADKNAAYAETFDQGALQLPPSKRYLLVTCMDARIDTSEAFGIGLGEAHVLRNAGGNAKDALRSIVISQQFLGTREIVLIKHTKCGMLTFTNEEAHAIVEKNLGPHVRPALEKLGDFQPFSNLEEAVKSDVKWLKEHDLVLRDIPITGWVYDVETGNVKNIV